MVKRLIAEQATFSATSRHKPVRTGLVLSSLTEGGGGGCSSRLARFIKSRC